MSALPPDQPARDLITGGLDRTLFVEAGAGAGKTSALVGRIVNLVLGGESIRSIAAITFTEKAAAELRSRVRRELERRVDDPAAATALGELDHAPIGTLHAFCRRILFDFPIESELPPGFTVLDQLESALEFDEAWDDLLARLLDDDAPAAGIVAGGADFVALCEFDKFTIQRSLRSIAVEFGNNWDLVETHVERTPPPPHRIDTSRIAALCDALQATPLPADDRQADVLPPALDVCRALIAADTFATSCAALATADAKVGKWAAKVPSIGAKGKWKSAGFTDDDLDAVRQLEHELGIAVSEQVRALKEYRKRVIGCILGTFVLDGAARRRRTGRLQFHDLLVLTRRLLVSNRSVRAALHERYTRLLLDEFQDTDPIQFEVAVRLTAAPDDPQQRAATAVSADGDATPALGSWRALRPLPGRLFVVGDPKQSIYRFRRADIAEYLRAAEQVGADDVTLTSNFRSSAAVIDWVNHVFGELIVPAPDTQPRFTPLDVRRAEPLRSHGTVHVLGQQQHTDLDNWSPADHDGRGKADELRRREAVDVAGAVRAALDDGWLVEDTSPPADSAVSPADPGGATVTADTGPRLRPCRPSDICILLPTRLPLPALAEALAEAGIAYRAENSSVVYATAEVRHLLGVLRAADDPTDELALLAALRSPLYGCSDIELWEWRRGGGDWGIFARPPEALADHPVADAIAHVRSVAGRLALHAPATLLAAIAQERRAFELALDTADGRDVWRRLRYVIDQARAWADAGGHGVRRYLRWATQQAAANQVSDAILPETDHDVVRVMTVHAAKGLEFPITVVAGLTSKRQSERSDTVAWTDSSWELRGNADDGGYETHKPLDEAMSDAERRRLLYVACTRAVDHLVVSTHRLSPPKNNPDLASHDRITAAELLWVGGAADAADLIAPASRAEPSVDAEPQAAAPPPHATPMPASTDLPWSDVREWDKARRATLAVASRRASIAATRYSDELVADVAQATALSTSQSSDPSSAESAHQVAAFFDDPGLDKQPVNVELPSWQRGRYGTSVGRAVHGVLQFCDLSTGSDIDELAAAQCAAEDVLGLVAEVAALARSALAAPIVQHAASGAAHRRELFVAAPVGGIVLEGYIDLLVAAPDGRPGYVIVDYKTDRGAPLKAGDPRTERYRLQLAAYGAALSVVLPQPVVGGILVHCRPNGPAQHVEVPEWASAVADVEQQLRAATGSDASSSETLGSSTS